VVIRTLDIGGDKTLKYHKFEHELNPFLGYRAVRFTLDNPAIFKTQLRALIRASAFGKLGIMFPMIATIDEFIMCKKIYNECLSEIKDEKKEFGQPQLGIMVEIPSTAVMADRFAKHVDFFSIGTNDLMQYSMAADRLSKKVDYLYQPLNPSILRLINMTIKAAHAEKK
jgi:phosphotransferase system enzyme I (PtsI)